MQALHNLVETVTGRNPSEDNPAFDQWVKETTEVFTQDTVTVRD